MIMIMLVTGGPSAMRVSVVDKAGSAAKLRRMGAAFAGIAGLALAGCAMPPAPTPNHNTTANVNENTGGNGNDNTSPNANDNQPGSGGVMLEAGVFTGGVFTPFASGGEIEIYKNVQTCGYHLQPDILCDGFPDGVDGKLVSVTAIVTMMETNQIVSQQASQLALRRAEEGSPTRRLSIHYLTDCSIPLETLVGSTVNFSLIITFDGSDPPVVGSLQLPLTIVDEDVQVP
jgi:hypothetical protein